MELTLYGGDNPRIYYARDIRSGVTITWGRSSLAEPPMNRTARFILPAPRRFPARLIPSRAVITLGSDNLFDGLVDTCTVGKYTSRPRVHLRATENSSWWSAWVREMELPARNRSYTASEIRTAIEQTLRKPENALTPGQPVTPPTLTTAPSIGASGPLRAATKEAYETLMQTAPLAYASWSPDMRTLATTAHSPTSAAAATTTIPAVNIVIDPEIVVTAESQAGVLTWEMEGAWNSTKNTVHKLVPGTRNFSLRRGNDLVVSTPLGLGGTADSAVIRTRIDPSLELLARQLTAPRRLRLSTAHTPTLPTSLILPWENGQTIHIPDDPIARYLTGSAAAYLRPIGGELTITPDRIDHDLTCIWVDAPT